MDNMFYLSQNVDQNMIDTILKSFTLNNMADSKIDSSLKESGEKINYMKKIKGSELQNNNSTFLDKNNVTYGVVFPDIPILSDGTLGDETSGNTYEDLRLI